ncbi:MAG TPA: response regulator [Nitrospirae bacterium]|nr:response regulator [Nitrospirota bacterium]
MGMERKYCLCCGENVPCNIVIRNERRELTCTFCGFILGTDSLWEDRRRAAGTYALIAEDSKFTRTLLKELILKKVLASEVTALSNGLELVSEYSRLLSGDIRVRFVIIDLNMPVMDGLTAARTLRTLEEKKKKKKVPILFFSGIKADEGFKKQMELLAPANYVNKGADSDTKVLVRRVEGLLNFISRHYQSA